jgi:hypothetical protein
LAPPATAVFVFSAAVFSAPGGSRLPADLHFRYTGPVSRSAIIVDRFAPEIPALRAVFDARFAEPRAARADRFVWDYWHVPDQYTALRTPAWTYFPRVLYARFHNRLVAWGRAHLGCHDISPPWLSLYIEGCRQELHGDLPHGPWAFVVSLTRWRGRRFRGGETLLLRDEVLDFWHDFASVRAVEQAALIRRIAPELGRLTVFDPRIPHGVREVTGTHDPREGRLVIHGWFVQPRPFVRGALPARALSARIAELTDQLGVQRRPPRPGARAARPVRHHARAARRGPGARAAGPADPRRHRRLAVPGAALPEPRDPAAGVRACVAAGRTAHLAWQVV